MPRVVACLVLDRGEEALVELVDRGVEIGDGGRRVGRGGGGDGFRRAAEPHSAARAEDADALERGPVVGEEPEPEQEVFVAAVDAQVGPHDAGEEAEMRRRDGPALGELGVEQAVVARSRRDRALLAVDVGADHVVRRRRENTFPIPREVARSSAGAVHDRGRRTAVSQFDGPGGGSRTGEPRVGSRLHLGEFGVESDGGLPSEHETLFGQTLADADEVHAADTVLGSFGAAAYARRVLLPPMTIMAWLRWGGIERALRAVEPCSILEIGAGQGAVGARLASRSRYAGIEPDPDSAAVARRRIEPRGALHPGSLDELPSGEPVDLVCAFEVLEHIEDDAAALRAWREQLTSTGSLLLSVPAHTSRFGPTDRLVGHHRRYDRAQLEALVTTAGFEVDAVEAYGAGLGHVLEWLRNRLVVRRGTTAAAVGTPGSGRFLQPRRLGGLVTAALAAPGRLLQRVLGADAPGVGWILRAHRVSSSADQASHLG